MLAAACAAQPASTTAPGADPATSGSGSSAPITPAHLALRLTDAPATFDQVNVTIASTEIADADGNWTTLSDQPQSFDLLTLQNDATALLGGNDLASGSYAQLRLLVSDASVVSGGVTTPLAIASGAQTGIKLNLDATVEDGMTYTLVIDYNAGQSIKTTGQGYLMTPVITVKSFSGAASTGSGS
ncbi:MAG: DUF4382 domain-containing protein [Acidobacteriota bacterium]